MSGWGFRQRRAHARPLGMSPLEQLLGLAARQHGCASYGQARASGLTAAQIRHRVTSGLLERHGDQVLRVRGSPRTWKQDLMAGLLDLGDGAFVSRRAAAALHGFDRFPPGAVEFPLDRRRRGRRSSWLVHTTATLDPIDRAMVDGLACTSAARTVIDLARAETPTMLERAIDSAVRDGLASPTFLRRRLEALRGPGRAGVRLLDAVLEDA